MALLLTILISIVCVLLILIILIQKPKGGGLGSSFGGGSSNILGGVQKTNQFLDKATWGLAIALLVLVLSTNLGSTGVTQSGQDVQDSEVINDQSTPLVNPGVGIGTGAQTEGQGTGIETDMNTEDDQ